MGGIQPESTLTSYHKKIALIEIFSAWIIIFDIENGFFFKGAYSKIRCLTFGKTGYNILASS